MADNANGLAQLELIRRRDLSGQETNVLQAFDSAMRSDLVPGAAAADAAARLDALCPPLEQDQEARDYIWNVWEVLFWIAASDDVPDQMHYSLLAVLQGLAQKTRGRLEGDEQRVWEDMYNLATCFDVHYRDPGYEDAKRTEQLAHNWHKLAIFGARALSARILGPYRELMLTIRFALEEDLNLNARPVAEMMQAEWSVKLACAWLAHGSALPLLKWAQENWDDGNVEHKTNSFDPGPLYHGPAIVCFERWQFWLHRLGELASPESGLGQDTRQSALNAIKTMEEAWDALATLQS